LEEIHVVYLSLSFWETAEIKRLLPKAQGLFGKSLAISSMHGSPDRIDVQRTDRAVSYSLLPDYCTTILRICKGEKGRFFKRIGEFFTYFSQIQAFKLSSLKAAFKLESGFQV
jgi:hypothetical protein